MAKINTIIAHVIGRRAVKRNQHSVIITVTNNIRQYIANIVIYFPADYPLFRNFLLSQNIKH